MRTYEELRGGHPPRDIDAELLRIGGLSRRTKRNVKPRILLNPRTGRKTVEYPLEDGSSLTDANRTTGSPSVKRPSALVSE